MTELTEVAFDPTATWAWRAVGVLPGAAIVQVAVLLPEGQLVNPATGPAGWEVSVIVIFPVGLAQF